ncbi:hypothetical protein [Asanoa siamensis]|uniref:DUF11 domain-containing protein n=1 Tax=Asanoa siamensis TaxID=926357 RepID=A0ABQ4D0J0_9ACTN|nr:hypothetical protein [Asanoa siamensis]GIF77031.1 hypothetical protein Asi02nite_65490 [Asanoa siamensis]
MRRNRRTLAVIAVLAAVLAAVTVEVTGTLASAGDPTNPATAPQPQYDYDDPAKAFVVELDFGSTSAALVRASVVRARSYSHLGDPPLLRLSLVDEDGAAGDSVNAWDPRWYFEQKPGGGERMVRRDGPGTLVVPFDADTATMTVRDLRAAIDLATVDLRPAVREFCLAHPIDTECVEADLAVTSTTASGDTLGVVGTPVTVQVAATVANLGPDGPLDADVVQTVAAAPGLTVIPAGRTFDADKLGVGTPAKVGGDYTVVCTSPGTRTVTVTTSVAPERAKVADVKPANDARTVSYAIDCAVPVAVNAEAIQPSTVRPGVRAPLVATGTCGAEAHGTVHASLTDLGIQNGTTEICVRGRAGPGAG